PPGAGDHVVPEAHALPSQPRDFGIEVVDEQVDAIPPARAGLPAVGMGRPAELVGPLSSSRRLPRLTSATGSPVVRRADPSWVVEKFTAAATSSTMYRTWTVSVS